jgi:hypothetical protein
VLLSISSWSWIGSVLICSIFRFFDGPGFLFGLRGFLVEIFFTGGEGGGGGGRDGGDSVSMGFEFVSSSSSI